MDLAGFRKDRFSLYQPQWRPDLPMAHILPHWTWPGRAGRVTPVHVFTSGDEAELFLNGRSLGRKKKGPLECRLRWDDVVYEPGRVEVVADREGERWAVAEVRTAGAPAVLALEPDRAAIDADGRDLAFVTVRVLDADGVLVARGQPDPVHRRGPGAIVATDNAEPTSIVPFPSHEREAFNSLALVIVKARPGEPGLIVVTAAAEGLQEAAATITAETARVRD